MNANQFKKIANLLKEVYAQIKQEALAAGIDILSPEYDQLIATARERLLQNMGFTLKQYKETKAKVESYSQADMLEWAEQTNTALEEVKARPIPTKEEITQLAHEVAQQYIKPPQITNQIIEKTTIEKPKIVKETITNITREEYNDGPIRAELGYIADKIEKIP